MKRKKRKKETKDKEDINDEEDEIVEEIDSIDVVEEKREIYTASDRLTSSKEKMIVDEIDMFNDNTYWRNNDSLKNKELIEELLNDFGK
jgi:hypothetical protein